MALAENCCHQVRMTNIIQCRWSVYCPKYRTTDATSYEATFDTDCRNVYTYSIRLIVIKRRLREDLCKFESDYQHVCTSHCTHITQWKVSFFVVSFLRFYKSMSNYPRLWPNSNARKFNWNFGKIADLVEKNKNKIFCLLNLHKKSLTLSFVSK